MIYFDTLLVYSIYIYTITTYTHSHKSIIHYICAKYSISRILYRRSSLVFIYAKAVEHRRLAPIYPRDRASFSGAGDTRAFIN